MKWKPEEIKKLRKQTGDTQLEFAKRLGFQHYQRVLELEKGLRKPSEVTQRLLEYIYKQFNRG